MGGLALTSCNDFLDRSPISDITPEDYFNTVDQVGSYVINYYDDYLENSNTTKNVSPKSIGTPEWYE